MVGLSCRLAARTNLQCDSTAASTANAVGPSTAASGPTPDAQSWEEPAPAERRAGEPTTASCARDSAGAA